MPRHPMAPDERLIEDIKHLSYEDWKKVRNYVTKLKQLERMDAKELSKLVYAGGARWIDDEIPDDGRLTCSFCGTSHKYASKLIAGENGYICDECIAECNKILKEESEKDKAE